MAFPVDALTRVLVNKYQGVVIAEIACTLVLFIILRIIYFCMWGYLYQTKSEDEEGKMYKIFS